MVNNFSYVTGGADRHCFDLARVLKQHGHDVALLATASRDSWEGPGAFIPLTVTNSTRDNLASAQRARVASRAVWNRSAEGAARRLIRVFRPDVVHVHKLYPHLSVSPIVQCNVARLPVVQTAHDYEFISASAVDDSGGRADRLEDRLQYRALNTALFQVKRRWHVPAVDRWVTVSRAVREIYARHGIVSAAVPHFTIASKEPVPPFAERQGVVYAGRLTTPKGLDDLIALARRLPAVPVHVAGDGPLVGRVRRAAAELPNLHFLGVLPREAVRQLFLSSRVCVMPSRWQEPAGLACLEAMAAGTPVVAYRVGGLAEYVEDSGGGETVHQDPSCLARACLRLTSDAQQWQNASTRAVAAVHTTHSPESYLSAILGIYESAIDRAKRAHA
jgi:glycosyltransferase involved in cell wall biosynthesis